MEGNNKNIKNVIEYWILQGELGNFIKVWICVYISLCYCYFIGKIVPKGLQRFYVILPVICLFLILPLHLHSMHLGITSAFFISWLANFKLFMFAFNIGHLSHTSVSLPRFLAVACLPIKIQHNPPPKSSQIKIPSQNGHFKGSPEFKTSKKDHQNLTSNSCSTVLTSDSQERVYDKVNYSSQLKISDIMSHCQICHISTELVGKNRNQKSVLNYAIKGILLATMIKIHDYSDQIHPKIILVLYCFHIYFALEIILGIAAAMARGVLGIELEPTFNEPMLSTSLQDFWGRRWNIMVNRILRPTVYDPVLSLTTKFLDRQWAPLPAVFGTFVVSGLMHELIFYYMGRKRPTGNISLFFMLHGLCLVIEVAVKKAWRGRWQLPRLFATLLVWAFVLGTGIWLFLPEMLGCNADVRAWDEYAAVGAFVKDVASALTLMPLTNSTKSQ